MPEGRRAGTGLPDHLRCWNSGTARILISMSNAAAVPTVEEAMNGATEENDEELSLALHTSFVVNVP